MKEGVREVESWTTSDPGKTGDTMVATRPKVRRANVDITHASPSLTVGHSTLKGFDSQKDEVEGFSNEANEGE